MDLLIEALLDGDQARAVAETGRLQSAGLDHRCIVTNGIEVAMARLDAKCTVEQFNLLEVMLSGRAVMGVMSVLYPHGAPMVSSKGTVVLGALEGDVHDLGKNILGTVLTASGYRIVDCGKDCPVARLVDAARHEDVIAVGVSGLMTTVIPLVRDLKGVMSAQGLDQVRLLAGGAALKQSSADGLNVDFVAQTAFDGLHYLNSITGGKG